MTKCTVTHFPSALELMRRISALRLVRRCVHIPADLNEELSSVQLAATERGMSFPVDYQVANYLRDLVKLAREQIAAHDVGKSSDQ